MEMLKWNLKHIENITDVVDMIKCFKKTKPTYGAFDTETNGLHIKLCTPFLFQFGWYNEDLKQGWAYAVDLEENLYIAQQAIMSFYQLAGKLEKLYGHNISYDLHMMRNVNMPYPHENVGDTIINIRLAHDNIVTKKGGAPLQLKKYSSRFISPGAKYHEQEIHAQRLKIANDLNAPLYKAFKAFPPPIHQTKTKSWGKGSITDFFKDSTVDENDFPYEGMKEIYLEWYASLPEEIKRLSTSKLLTNDDIPYNMVDRALVIKYGLYDIVWTLEIVRRTLPVIDAREQQVGLKIEEDCILPLFEQEEVGFLIDKDYIYKVKPILKNYIKERREYMYELAGRIFKTGSAPAVKDILETLGLEVESTGKEVLSKVLDELRANKENQRAQDFITVLQEMRTLEKWYSTYLLRLEKELALTDRAYTGFNSVGAVSLRQTSDFQQYPRKGIKTHDGKPLFNPRRAILTDGGDYPLTLYIDYSQIELRIQAFYTMLVGTPDLNLLRAYMPYQCSRKDGTQFNPYDKDMLKQWNTKDWYLDEEPDVLWTPTDVHTATTLEAFPELTTDHKDFDYYRSEFGKFINFSKNYGAGIGQTAARFPDKTPEEIAFIDGSYYRAFPGIKGYHTYCYDIVNYQGYAQNLFGVKYYGMSGHYLTNYLVQGTGAHLLKIKIKEIRDFMKKHDLKSKMQMNIHDEISWMMHRDELHYAAHFQRIMEDISDWWVPVVADIDYSTTNWASKVKGVTADELENVFNG